MATMTHETMVRVTDKAKVSEDGGVTIADDNRKRLVRNQARLLAEVDCINGFLCSLVDETSRKGKKFDPIFTDLCALQRLSRQAFFAAEEQNDLLETLTGSTAL